MSDTQEKCKGREASVYSALGIVTILFQKQKIGLKQIQNHATEFLRNNLMEPFNRWDKEMK